MSYIDAKEILQELVVFIRNADVMSVTDRSVTTATATGTFSATSTLDISVSNVKNIRSITVGGVLKTRYTDYTVNYNYSTTKTRITFIAAQTGVYSIPYDYGTDKIFPDYPKAEMKISNFPRIAIEILDIPSEAGGFGNVVKNDINFTVVVYSKDKEDIMDYIKAIKTAFGNSWTSFYNLGHVIRPTGTGPILNSEDTNDKIFQQNIDFKSLFKYECN